VSNTFGSPFKDKGQIEGDEVMLRPIDLQVVIVKSVDSAQSVGYSQQMMSSAQQIAKFEEQKRDTLNRSRIVADEKKQNSNVGTSTDSNGNGRTLYTFKKRKKDDKTDPYRGKVIDIRL
jgi:hypothetical protein